jgi:hypothetical protein
MKLEMEAVVEQRLEHRGDLVSFNLAGSLALISTRGTNDIRAFNPEVRTL